MISMGLLPVAKHLFLLKTQIALTRILAPVFVLDTLPKTRRGIYVCMYVLSHWKPNTSVELRVVSTMLGQLCAWSRLEPIPRASRLYTREKPAFFYTVGIKKLGLLKSPASPQWAICSLVAKNRRLAVIGNTLSASDEESSCAGSFFQSAMYTLSPMR